MKNQIKMLAVTIILTLSTGVQAMECTKIINDVEVKLEVSQDEDEAIVTYNGKSEKFAISGLYDGHMTSLLTGEGIAITYQNHFGCLRMASLTTILNRNVREISFDKCQGGSTPDDLCFPNRN